ncbi:MAG: VWA domain-containing protein [Planctomycetota bacterium]|nr:VWA domain-containing protein [Planctomycetota bacterium]
MGALEILVPFRHKPLLFLLLIPALLLYWTWSRRGRHVVLPFDHAGHGSAQRGTWIRFFLNGAESLPAILLTIVILILAGPQKWDEPRTQRVLTNIEFCVDVSGSMNASFAGGTRYEASMEAINDFLDYRDGDAFGLTFFGNSVLHWVPLTTDVSAFRCAPPFMKPRNLPPWFGGTEIGKALLACRKILVGREEGDRMIILVSDGVSSDLRGGRDEEIARDLANDNVTVYAVHIGGSSPPDAIVNITSMTGGEVFNPGDPESLEHVFQQIDAMQETQIEKTRSEAVDDYATLCWIGLSVLGGAVLVLFGLRYTPW